MILELPDWKSGCKAINKAYGGHFLCHIISHRSPTVGKVSLRYGA